LLVLDTVTVHYVGTIVSDGSTFGSSRVRSVLKAFFFPTTVPLHPDSVRAFALPHSGTPFITEIGVGKVIKGWDEGERAPCELQNSSVTPLMVADMVRCPAANAGFEGNIKSIPRLCAYRICDRTFEQNLRCAVLRRMAPGVFHQSYPETLPLSSKWSSLR
jgi:hypothetical protein